ncbi:MAG: HD domain-containing protein [Patescibacteria group bacterium]
MKIADIYTKYLLPKNLQEHMFRVAAIATIITENWKGEDIPKEDVVNVCLFHDIAKPLTFTEEKQKMYGTSEEEIANIKKFKQIITAKYGSEEHHATLAICKEEGLNERAIGIMHEFEWKNMQKMFDTNNLPVQIVLYCDMRIGPNGILPLQERLKNIETRYGKGLDHEMFMRLGLQLEKVIQEKTKIELNLIQENDLETHFSTLQNRSI